MTYGVKFCVTKLGGWYSISDTTDWLYAGIAGQRHAQGQFIIIVTFKASQPKTQPAYFIIGIETEDRGFNNFLLHKFPCLFQGNDYSMPMVSMESILTRSFSKTVKAKKNFTRLRQFLTIYSIRERFMCSNLRFGFLSISTIKA